MSNLPLNWPDKIDSPELVAWLQQFGLGRYINAEQINKLRDGVNELYYTLNPDRIITIGTETIVDNEHTYEGYVWQLGGVQIDNTGNPSVLIIPAATVGFKRKDISVFTSEGNIIRVAGDETDGDIVTTPPTPPGTLYFKSYDINGDTIEASPEPPVIDGSIYKKKIEELGYGDTSLTGENAVIKLRPEGYSRYAFSNPDLVSILGFSLELINGNPTAEVPYPSKNLFIENTGSTSFTLIHDSAATADRKFFFLDENDLVVPPGGKVWLKYDLTAIELFWKSWVDLSSKADLVGGKVPTEQLPSYVDDVLEFANLAAFPATGETGKIYVDLSTNLQYRWSGSAYINFSGKPIFIIKDFLVATGSSTNWRFRTFQSGTSYTPTVLDSGTSTFLTALTGSGASSIPYQTHSSYVAPFDTKLKSITILKTDVFGGETFKLAIGSHLKTNNSNTVTDGVSILEVEPSKGSYSVFKHKYTSADFGDITIPSGHSLVVGWINQGRGIEIYFEMEKA